MVENALIPQVPRKASIDNPNRKKQEDEIREDYTLKIANAKNEAELKTIYAEVKSNKGLVALITARKKELENG